MFTPIPRQLLARDINEISGSFRGRGCQHDRRSLWFTRQASNCHFVPPNWL